MEEVDVVSDFGRLEIGRTSTVRRKRRKKVKAGPKRNCERAYGFDYSSDVYEVVWAARPGDYRLSLYARFGLYCYNYFHKGTNIKFVRCEKYLCMCTAYVDFYLTLEAKDPACNSVFPFQTLFRDACHTAKDTYIINTWQILACRPSCKKPVNDYWDRHGKSVDQFYTGPMPKWLSDEALATDNKKYYVVQESELHENDWLLLFVEMAFSSLAWDGPSSPLEINKVVVETKEDYITEAREKLHAENAIFYISYKYRGLSSSRLAGDHKAIIRKTMDGEPEHMSLEIASERKEE